MGFVTLKQRVPDAAPAVDRNEHRTFRNTPPTDDEFTGINKISVRILDSLASISVRNIARREGHRKSFSH
jgi:hypothetical protein